MANATLDVTTNSDGAINAVSSDTDIAEVSVVDKTVTIIPQNNGACTVTVSVSDNPNYVTPPPVTCAVRVTTKADCNLSLSKSELNLRLPTVIEYINVSREGTGEITAVSSNPRVADVTVSGTRIAVTSKNPGTAVITVSVAEDENHYATSKTCTVTSVMPPILSPAEGRGAAEIKSIVDAGLTSKYLHVGEFTPLIPLNGTLGDLTFDNYEVRFRIVHVQDGHPIFMLWCNADDIPIALTSPNYGTYIEANVDSIVMNRKGQVGLTIDPDLTDNAKNYGPNKGGWEKSYCRIVLMVQFKALLPEEWQNIIIPTTIWTDNVGNLTNDATSVTSTIDECFVLDEIELFGKRYYGNSYTNQRQVQFDFFKAGNSLKAYRHDNPTVAINYEERGPFAGYSSNFCIVNTSGSAHFGGAAFARALRPAFRV